jgi:hypothetical protein
MQLCPAFRVPPWTQVVWAARIAKIEMSAVESAVLKVSPTVGGAGCFLLPLSAITAMSTILPRAPFTTVPKLDGPVTLSGPVSGGSVDTGVGVGAEEGVAVGEADGVREEAGEGVRVGEATGVGEEIGVEE